MQLCIFYLSLFNSSLVQFNGYCWCRILNWKITSISLCCCRQEGGEIISGKLSCSQTCFCITTWLFGKLKAVFSTFPAVAISTSSKIMLNMTIHWKRRNIRISLPSCVKFKSLTSLSLNMSDTSCRPHYQENSMLYWRTNAKRHSGKGWKAVSLYTDAYEQAFKCIKILFCMSTGSSLNTGAETDLFHRISKTYFFAFGVAHSFFCWVYISFSPSKVRNVIYISIHICSQMDGKTKAISW